MKGEFLKSVLQRQTEKKKKSISVRALHRRKNQFGYRLDIMSLWGINSSCKQTPGKKKNPQAKTLTSFGPGLLGPQKSTHTLSREGVDKLRPKAKSRTKPRPSADVYGSFHVVTAELIGFDKDHMGHKA